MELIEQEGAAASSQAQEGDGIGTQKIGPTRCRRRGRHHGQREIGFAADLRESGSAGDSFRFGDVQGACDVEQNLKLSAMEEAGLSVVERVPLEVRDLECAMHYLLRRRRDGPPAGTSK